MDIKGTSLDTWRARVLNRVGIQDSCKRDIEIETKKEERKRGGWGEGSE